MAKKKKKDKEKSSLDSPSENLNKGLKSSKKTETTLHGLLKVVTEEKSFISPTEEEEKIAPQLSYESKKQIADDYIGYLKKANKVALEEALENLKYAFEFDDLYGDSENIIKEKDYKHSSFMFYDGYRNNSPKGITIPWKKGLEIAQKNINLIVEFGKVR